MDSVIVLVLLGVIWAAVLVPPWLKGRREAQPAASIRVFRRQLWRLGQGPVAGARRERYGAVRFVSDDGAVAYGPGGTLARAEHADRVSQHFEGVDRLERLDLEALAAPSAVDVYGDEYASEAYDEVYDGLDDEAVEAGLGYGSAARRTTRARTADGGVITLEPDWSSAGPREVAGSAARRWAERNPQMVGPETVRSTAAARNRARARAYRRRRQVMALLLITVAVTLAWALVLGYPGLWVAQVVADALLVGYVTLLVRLRRRSTERADKVRYLAPIEAPRPAVVVLHG
jgi:hypothetical protein